MSRKINKDLLKRQDVKRLISDISAMWDVVRHYHKLQGTFRYDNKGDLVSDEVPDRTYAKLEEGRVHLHNLAYELQMALAEIIKNKALAGRLTNDLWQ